MYHTDHTCTRRAREYSMHTIVPGTIVLNLFTAVLVLETRITSTSAPKSTKSIALSEDVQQWRYLYRVYSLHSFLIIVVPTVSLCFSLGLS